MADDKTLPSADVLLYLADTQLACGLQYGLWVERSPNVEEQIALSSMSQDKLGHARAFGQLAEMATGQDKVALQYDRAPDAFRWNPAWVQPFGSWQHLVVGQVLYGRALQLDATAFATGTQVHDIISKVVQEDVWHQRHGDAWLEAMAAGHVGQRAELDAAFEALWPAAVAFFGLAGAERFPDDVASGLRTRSDAALRQAYLADVVPFLEGVGLKVPAHEDEDGTWQTEPGPTQQLIDRVRDEGSEQALELVGLLQDPAGRALAEL